MMINNYEIWRLETPMGRVIGDSNCHYESMDVVALCLKTNQAHAGWGYGVALSKGVFTRPAWYIQPMASLVELRREFEQSWWPLLQTMALGDGTGVSACESGSLSDRQGRLSHQVMGDKTGLSHLDAAVRMALWDLTAQEAGLPLYRFLGGKTDRVRAYGSVLDFPLSEEEAISLARNFVKRGFRAIKIKVGADDVRRDTRRLQAIREAVGPDIELTADANTMWTWEQTVERVRVYESHGIHLGYIEDPLPHTDRAGFARLGRELAIDVVGHDYAATAGELRALLETGGIKRLRNGKDIDHSLACAKLAGEFGVPMIFGNSIFEFNVHAACALPNVDRLEFSDLAWNCLMREPVRFENGHAIAPSRPGHGLDPIPDRLHEFSKPEA